MNDVFDNFMNNEVNSESLKRVYETIFDGIKYIEDKSNKRVQEFGKEELIEIIELYGKGKTYNSTMVKVSLIKKFFHYIGNYAIDDLISNIDNLISDSQDAQNGRYISKKELFEISKKLMNVSDRCVLMLLRNGIGIKYEIEDLINITIDDINFENNTIYNKPIDKTTMDLVKKTLKEREYLSIGAYEKIIVYNMSSRYLFKTRMTKSTNDGLSPFRPSGFRGRLQRIKTYLDNDDRVILSNLILSHIIDLVVEYEIENNIDMGQSDLRRFLKNTIGSGKNIYDIFCTKKYVKNTIAKSK